MKYIIAIGVFQALVALVLLCTKSRRNKADALLIYLIVCIGAHLSIKFFIYAFTNDAEAQNQLNTFIGLSYGPLLYLFAKKKKDELFIPASQWYIFIPTLLAAIAYLTVVCLLCLDRPVGDKILHLYNNASNFLFIGLNFLFAVIAFSISKNYPASLKAEQNLINKLCYCFFSSTLVSIVYTIFISTIHVQPDYSIRIIVYSILILECIFILQYKFPLTAEDNSIQIPSAQNKLPEINNVLSAVLQSADISDIDENGRSKERKLLLSNERHKDIINKIDVYLCKTKIYREAEINLDTLAKGAGISKHHISEALNAYANKSFYQFINEYRIDEIKSRMQQLAENDVPVNVLSLAYGCGFKAKSSFNSYFKKITGNTPSEYLKAIRMNVQKA